MPSCINPEMKYLRPYEAGIIVEINRADQFYTKKFTFRQNSGYEKTLANAKQHRDEMHLAMFGYPVSRRFFHITKRKSKGGKSDLPAGISHGYSRGKLLYIVASYCNKEGKPSRKRFNITKLGYDECMTKALEFLKAKRIEIIVSLDDVNTDINDNKNKESK